ncbi:MAG: hypothetical protein ACJAX3_001163 [Patiriisocius sp.]|jgi:hypothetical protein
MILEKVIKVLSNNIGVNVKNKIVVIESDDWGSIRMPSVKTREVLERNGLDLGKGKEHYRYSLYDTLASKDDLDGLFNVLKSFKDSIGNHPVFTAMALVANPDFEAILKSGFTQYVFEPLPDTLKRYGLEDSLPYWHEGFNNHIFVPEFHGREHLNISSWMRNLISNDYPTRLVFDSKMWAVKSLSKINYQAAFDLELPSDLKIQHEVLASGLELFEELFNRKARYFVPPNGPINNSLFETAKAQGIDYISSAKLQKEVFGHGRFKTRLHWLGKKNRFNQYTITRNCFFEPSDKSKDWIESCLNDMEQAFRYNKPAVISSHRVNFVGTLDIMNRDNGLKSLNILLKNILQKWPDVIFLSSSQLGDVLSNKVNLDEVR